MDIRHRTRFRRNIPTNRKRNGFSEDDIRVSGILSDLGSRLGTFKVNNKHGYILESGICVDLPSPYKVPEQQPFL
jgi:hypothetical protein